jgi:hypothetical protein
MADEYTYSTDENGRRTRIPTSFNSQTDEGYYPLQIEGRCTDCGCSMWVSCGDASTANGRRPSGRCPACVERKKPSPALVEARNRSIQAKNWWSAWWFRQQERCADLCTAIQLPLLSFLMCVALPVSIGIITNSKHTGSVGLVCILVVWPTLHQALSSFWRASNKGVSFYQPSYQQRRKDQALFGLLLWGIGVVIFSSSIAIAYYFF